jgi:phosphinothricin acetyltransferase
MTGRFVRAARLDDMPRIAEIYNQGIEDRIATFETDLRTPQQIAQWFDSGYVILVSGEHGRIAAYAVAFPYRARPCYDGVREFSVYTAREHRGAGHGKAAMIALIEDCTSRGWWKLLSRVFPENQASLALCQSLGFSIVGTYRKHARLDGRWRDVVVVEKLLMDDD